MKNFILLFVVLSFIMVSCNKGDTQFLSYEEQLAVDTKIIEDYLSANGITAETTTQGMYYNITDEGNGISPSSGDIVVVNYVGKLLNGTTFDSNTSGGFSFALGQGRVIQGWDIGIALLGEGGKATLYIPSGLAYGTRGAGSSIGPNEVLIFDVELVSF